MTGIVQQNELKDFFKYVIDILDDLQIPYMVVGGFAAIFYGEPRFTMDVDIVVDMQVQHIPPFVQAFPIPEYYASEEGVRDSLLRRYPFNVIHSSTGAKVDLVPLPNDPFTKLAFQRRQSIKYGESERIVHFVSPEDIVIAKLIAFKETNSDKHLRDAQGVLALQKDTIDLDAIRRGAKGADVTQQLEELLCNI